MNIHIHTIETGNQCREHQDDGQTCHAFHDRIHVIGDNGGKSIHRSRENITVNIHRVECLFQLDNHIFH